MQIAEIFQSIDGEVNRFGQGRLTTFIRTSECNLNCPYCDTPQGRGQGRAITVGQIVERVKALGCKKITITGGFAEVNDKGLTILAESAA